MSAALPSPPPLLHALRQSSRLNLRAPQVMNEFRQMLYEQMSKISRFLTVDESQIQAEYGRLQALRAPGNNDALQSVIFFAQFSALSSRVESLQRYTAINFVAINKV